VGDAGEGLPMATIRFLLGVGRRGSERKILLELIQSLGESGCRCNEHITEKVA
jgi:hypothetical protein